MEHSPCSMAPRELDGAVIEDRQQLHDELIRLLDLPDYYGRNLDALADCLGDVSQPIRIELINGHLLDEHLGDYARVLRQVFRDASEDNPAITFHES